jgi:hypothetical protein
MALFVLLATILAMSGGENSTVEVKPGQPDMGTLVSMLQNV